MFPSRAHEGVRALGVNADEGVVEYLCTYIYEGPSTQATSSSTSPSFIKQNDLRTLAGSKKPNLSTKAH